MSLLVTAGLSLLQYVPEIVEAFTSDKEEVSEKLFKTGVRVIKENIPTEVRHDINTNNPGAVVKALKESPDLALKFQQAVMEDKHVYDKMLLDNTKNARKMYSSVDNSTANSIGTKIIKENLWFIFALVTLQLLAMYFLKDEGQILALLGNTVGFVLNGLLKERQDVVNFFFGSSLGSKMKNKQQ